MTPRDRHLAISSDATQTLLFWARVQRARCTQDATHYQRLVDTDTRAVVIDLGPCRHHPKGEQA